MNYLVFVEEDNYQSDEISEILKIDINKETEEAQNICCKFQRKGFNIVFHRGGLNLLPADFRFLFGSLW